MQSKKMDTEGHVFISLKYLKTNFHNILHTKQKALGNQKANGKGVLDLFIAVLIKSIKTYF